MALSASGLGSGLDVQSLVSQLMSLEQRPLTTLARKEASYQAKLSAFGQIKGGLSSLQSAAEALKDAAKFTSTRATVGSDAGFTASTASGASAGNFSAQVEQLARTQRVATSAGISFDPADGTVEAPKTLEIRFGKMVDGMFQPGQMVDGSFTPGAGETKTLNFSGSSIEDLRDAINKGDLGVSASIVDNGTAKQLVLTGKNTGADQAFSIGGTVGLNYTPGEAAGAPTDPVYRLQSSQDARVNIDGIVVTRGSNTVSGAIEGVTLTLSKETDKLTNVTVAEDFSSARGAIDSFVKAYNESLTTLKSLTTYNAEVKTGSTLTGDATARGIQSQVRSLVGGALSGLGNTTRLADIGITFDKEGKLAVDGGKLDTALKDPKRSVAAFFTGSGDTKGFAATVADGLKSYLDNEGLLAGRTESLNSSIKLLGKQRTALELRLQNVEKRYTAQFNALDSTISSLTQTSTYLTQQLANLSTST
jgi:flagellar hook-associated protein 2